MSNDASRASKENRAPSQHLIRSSHTAKGMACVTAVGVWMLGLSSCGLSAVTPEPPRHAVLITIDTLRADRLGAYGCSSATTPNLDALADESIRFESAYSHSPKTFPSISTLLSGRPLADHGIFNNGGKFPQGLPTVATILSDLGFETAAFIGSYALRPNRELDRGFDSYTQEYLTTEAVRPHPENHAGPLTDEAIAWLASRDPTHRLFLWIHYQEPHGAYTPPSFRAPAEDGDGLVLEPSPTNSGKGAIPKYQWLGHGRLSEYEARYDGEITEFDRHLGRLVDTLETTGILDRSIVVLTADHGEAFGEDNLYCAHGEGLGEVLLRVPLLVRMPGHSPVVRTDTVRLIDVPRTILETLSVDANVFQGHNLLQMIGDRPVVAQVTHRGRHFRSYRNGDYELRQASGERPKLHARTGLSAEGNDAVFVRMERDLRKLAPWPMQLEQEPLSQEERDALRAMGYLD
jgi:arylsulfatase A-like enzyme